MALTAVERTNIVKLTVALYNAAPGASGLSDFTTFYEANGRNLNALALNLANNNIFKSLNPNTQLASEFATSVLSVYGLQNNTDAIAFVTSRFNAGVSKGQIAFEAALAVNNTTSTTGDFANARALFNNKALVAEAYSVGLSGQSVSIGTLQGVLNNVTADSASVAAANTANLIAASQSLILTTGQDNLTGTAGPDIFVSNVVQNGLGLQVNTLGSGDNLFGGSGTDTLNAKVTAGAFAGGFESMPIQAETRSIEVIKLQAASSGITAAATDTQVYVNARSMVGVSKIGSSFSDADLVVMNMTTLDNAGVQRAVSDLTVGMEYTGNADTRFGASDLTVLFDQDYLTAASRSSSAIEIRLVNTLQLAVDQKGLTLFKAVSFFVGGTAVVVDIPPAITSLASPAAYNALVTAIQARLTTLNITDVVVSALPVRETVFSDDVVASPEQPNSFARGQSAGFYTPILVTSKGAPLVRGQASTADTAQNTNILNTQLFSSDTQSQLVTINVDLEKAGLAGDGGNLIIGSMNKTSANVFNAVETNTDTRSGIEQFTVSVKGDATKSTSIASLQSTNNNLRVVTATTDAAVTGNSFAGLEIGNTRTGSEIAGVRQVDPRGLRLTDLPTANNANSLKDVQTFDANGLKGNLTLFAAITTESVAKYMTLGDGANNAAADNVTFTYSGGSGNDYISLNIASDNLRVAGTTTREDFVLAINGGAGDDRINTQIGDGTIPVGSNWYANSKINANLTINAGDGNDTVRTFGSGDFIINAGSGNDTVYADNTGIRAVYVFNAADGDAVTAGNQFNLTNLLSQQPEASVSAVNANLTVTFKGIQNLPINSLPVSIGGSTGATANVTITDLSINQAIKTAINGDAVLNKLLIAEDGPGRTLVVRSLIDGADIDVADLVITFGSTALSPSQVAAVTPTNNLVLFSVAAAAKPLLLDGYGVIGGFNTTNNSAPFATDAVNVNVIGTNSTAVADNTITPGLGNDVIVLGTGADSNDIIRYSGFGNGTDTVVNFNAAGGNQDFLSFTGYGLTGTGGINGGIFVGAVATDKVGTYIQLVENATNAGEYTISLVNLGATSALTDNIAPVTIAVVDFGATQAFTSGSFNPTVLPQVSPVNFSVTAPAAASEGASATYTVTLAGAPTTATTVNYTLGFGGTATAADLGAGTALTGTLTFAPGVTTQTVVVPFATDAVTPEAGETVTLTLSAPSAGSFVATAAATTAITDVAGSTIVVTATPVTGTAVADNFTFDANPAPLGAAKTDAAGTNFQTTVNGFTATGAAADRFTFDFATANAAITTLAQLNGQQGVTVQADPFANSTLINFGPDANGGQIVTITLAGVVDATTVAISVV